MNGEHVTPDPAATSLPNRPWVERVWALVLRHWLGAVFTIAALALLVRLAAVVGTGSHADLNLKIYYYFSDLFRHGVNPYHAPVGGRINPIYGDNPPGLFALFAGFLALHDSAVTLRVLFAVADVAVIATIGLLFPRPKSFRFGFMLFYAFSPLVLLNWTVTAQDKTLTFLLIVLVLAAVELNRPRLCWIAATALAAIKWMTGFFLLPLVTWTFRTMSRGKALVLLSGSALVFAIASLPYFPDNLVAYQRRSNRMGYDPPIHQSITRLLDAVHLYTPLIPRVLGPLLVLMVWVLYERGKLRIAETIALSLFFAYVFLPDQGSDRILLIVLPLILVTRTTTARWAWIWAISIFASIGGYANLAGSTDYTGRFPSLPGPVVDVVGASGLHDVVTQNLILICILVFFLRDRLPLPGFARAREPDGVAVSPEQPPARA